MIALTLPGIPLGAWVEVKDGNLRFAQCIDGTTHAKTMPMVGVIKANIAIAI